MDMTANTPVRDDDAIRAFQACVHGLDMLPPDSDDFKCLTADDLKSLVVAK